MLPVVDNRPPRKSKKRTRIDRDGSDFESKSDHESASEVDATRATVKDEKEPEPPEYNEMVLAKTIFSDEYFYHDKESAFLLSTSEKCCSVK
jgi:hypothetical protein